MFIIFSLSFDGFYILEASKEQTESEPKEIATRSIRLREAAFYQSSESKIVMNSCECQRYGTNTC